MQFFSEWQELKFLKKSRDSCPAEGYRNIDGFIGEIVASGKATLQELKTVYTLQEAMQIWETIAIPKYNEYMAYEQAKRKQGRR